MKNYKRLTERVGKGISVKSTSTNDNKSIWNAIERLAELEDKIENGEMFSIPFIWKRKKYNNHNEFVLVYEGDYGSLLTELFIGENAETRAIKKLKELKREV